MYFSMQKHSLNSEDTQLSNQDLHIVKESNNQKHVEVTNTGFSNFMIQDEIDTNNSTSSNKTINITISD